MRRTTITAKHARALHADIKRREADLSGLHNENIAIHSDLSKATSREAALRADVDSLNNRLAKMGIDIRSAIRREMDARDIASDLLDGVNTVCIAAQSLSVQPYLTRTLLTIQRDGRAQLAKSINAVGAEPGK